MGKNSDKFSSDHCRIKLIADNLPAKESVAAMFEFFLILD